VREFNEVIPVDYNGNWIQVR